MHILTANIHATVLLPQKGFPKSHYYAAASYQQIYGEDLFPEIYCLLL